MLVGGGGVVWRCWALVLYCALLLDIIVDWPGEKKSEKLLYKIGPARRNVRSC